MPLPLILRWPIREAAHEPLLARLGADQILGEEAVEGALTSGLWPGIRSPGAKGGNPDVASASREPWVDSSGYLAAVQRALGRPSLLAHQHRNPEQGVPFESLELALVEARVNGGNFVLSVEPRYRKALLAGEDKALAAWSSLAQTAAWLRKYEGLFGRPTLPTLTALVEPGYATTEIANLLFRRGGSPRLAAAANVPKPDPERTAVLVAAGLKEVPAAAWEHAAAGATVVIDSAPAAGWNYGLGRGQVVAYHKRVQDPSEFALDCIDLVTHKRRAARLWNAPSAIPLATAGGLLHVIQYGSPIEVEIQARVQGLYRSATLLRPEGPPLALKLYRRGTMSEVFPPSIQRLGVVQFE
ncbi:MAG: hypothetical protein NTX13_16940 [Acidobacteria bacterium]|nr:hypothetical protein [Acidobacteriota bacterium]